MEALAKILERDFQKELDCSRELKKCGNCGEPIQKDINICNKIRRVPIVCSCKRNELEKKAREKENSERQDRLNQIFKNSLMDEKFHKATFETWDHSIGSEKIYSICIKYAENFKKAKIENIGLLIYGEPGNGKSHAVSCIANYLLNKGVPTICVSIDGILKRIKETYSNYGKEGEDTILKTFACADLLIIDDLGTEQTSDWSISKIYNIIDSRYRNELPTIITTNINILDLKELYHQRTYDRLLEMCTPVLNDGESIRREKGKEKTKLLKEILS